MIPLGCIPTADNLSSEIPICPLHSWRRAGQESSWGQVFCTCFTDGSPALFVGTGLLLTVSLAIREKLSSVQSRCDSFSLWAVVRRLLGAWLFIVVCVGGLWRVCHGVSCWVPSIPESRGPSVRSWVPAISTSSRQCCWVKGYSLRTVLWRSECKTKVGRDRGARGGRGRGLHLQCSTQR